MKAPVLNKKLRDEREVRNFNVRGVQIFKPKRGGGG
jgi:hypothetical protein